MTFDQLMTKLVRLLLIIIPSERGYKLKEEQEAYKIDNELLTSDLPIP